MANRYFVGSGNTNDTARWSTSSDGAGGASVPTENDIAYFDANSGDATVNAAFLLGSAYSHFSRQVVRPLSGTPIETIDNPSLLSNAISNMTMDNYEK